MRFRIFKVLSYGSLAAVIVMMMAATVLEKLQLRESASSVRAKLVAGRELLYENMFARSEELHYMRVTLRRLHRFMGEDL